MTTYFAISGAPVQYEITSGVPASGYVLKAYTAGTSDNISMATDYTGAGLTATMTLNAAGYPVVSGNVVIPHIAENYKLALYPSQSAANSDTGAIWTIDNIQVGGTITSEGALTNVASSATVNLNSTDTNYFNITGTTGITAITLAEGNFVTVKFASSLLLTNSSFLVLKNDSDISTASGDIARFRGESGGVVRLIEYSRYSGESLVEISGFRNRIINGGMLIDQLNEGFAQTFTAGAALAWCVDQFYGYCTGANVTGQQINGSGSNKKFYSFTGAASVTGIGFGTRLPSFNTFDLAGGNAILTIDTSNTLLTSMSYAVYYANSENAFGTLSSPTRTLISSGTITINSTTTRYGIPITMPAGATTGLEIVFSVGAQISGSWLIGNVGIQSGNIGAIVNGTSVPIFERRLKITELQLCQEFLRKTFSQGTKPAQNVGTNTGELQFSTTVAGTNTNYGYAKFSSPMFAAPSLTFYNPAATNAQARDLVVGGDCSGLATANITDSGFRIAVTGNAGTAVGNPLAVHYIAAARIP